MTPPLNVLAEFPAGSGDRDGPTAEAEILRGELSRLLVEAGGPGVEYVFGDYVTGLHQATDHLTVDVASGDLVFDDDVQFRHLGLYTAYGTIPRTAGDDDVWGWFNAPGGRAITLRPANLGSIRVTLSFLSAPGGYEDMDPAATNRKEP